MQQYIMKLVLKYVDFFQKYIEPVISNSKNNNPYSGIKIVRILFHLFCVTAVINLSEHKFNFSADSFMIWQTYSFKCDTYD